MLGCVFFSFSFRQPNYPFSPSSPPRPPARPPALTPLPSPSLCLVSARPTRSTPSPSLTAWPHLSAPSSPSRLCTPHRRPRGATRRPARPCRSRLVRSCHDITAYCLPSCFLPVPPASIPFRRHGPPFRWLQSRSAGTAPRSASISSLAAIELRARFHTSKPSPPDFR